MSSSNPSPLRLLTAPVRLAMTDPRVTAPLLWAALYYPQKLQSYLPDRLKPLITSAGFITALKIFLAFGFLRSVSSKLSELVVNNWRPNAKFLKSQEVVLITGGSGGLGLAMAKEFAKMGVKVVILDVNPPKTEYPPSIKFYQVDVTSSTQIATAAAEIRSAVGDPTVLINNAGVANLTTILGGTEEGMRKTFEVNAISHFLTTREFLPAMIKKNRGHVVTVCSVTSYLVLAQNVDYSCTKAATLAFHEGLSSELKNKYNAPDVKTTIVNPSWIRTPLTQSLLESPQFKGIVLEPEDVASEIVNQVVSGRSGQIILPKSVRYLSTMRSWPWWLQTGIRNRAANKVTLK